MKQLIVLAIFLYGCDLKKVTDDEIRLTVSSNPSGASIYFDNVNTGFTTPHTFRDMDEQTITVKLIINADYPEYTEFVILDNGDKKTLNPTLKAFWEHDWAGDVTLNNLLPTFEPFADLTVPGIVNAQIRVEFQWLNLFAVNAVADGKVRFNGIEIAQVPTNQNFLIINQSALIRNSTGKIMIDYGSSNITQLKVTAVILTIQ